jgi:drug/metabolite transporter (DMT)-like permease
LVIGNLAQSPITNNQLPNHSEKGVIIMQLSALFWLAVLALLWGPAYLFMKVAVQEVPPLTVATTRVALGAILLYLILKMQGRSLPNFGPVWARFAVMGLTANALPFFLLSWGQQYVDSALAAISVGASPLFTMLLAHFFTTDDRFSVSKMMGMVVGFGGLVVLFVPTLFERVDASLWGLAATTGAGVSYSIAFVYARQRLPQLPPLVGPAAQLLMASVWLLPIALVVDQPYTLPALSWPVIASLLLVTVWSTVLAFVIYYRVMKQFSATILSLVSYLNPIVATILGVLVLQEQLDWNGYLGYVLIILSAIIVNGTITVPGWRRLGRSWRRAPISS